MNNDNIYLLDETCIICYEYVNEYVNENIIIFDCCHKICLSCYEKMLNQNQILYCPICRHTIENNTNKNEYSSPELQQTNQILIFLISIIIIILFLIYL